MSEHGHHLLDRDHSHVRGEPVFYWIPRPLDQELRLTINASATALMKHTLTALQNSCLGKTLTKKGCRWCISQSVSQMQSLSADKSCCFTGVPNPFAAHLGADNFDAGQHNMLLPHSQTTCVSSSMHICQQCIVVHMLLLDLAVAANDAYSLCHGFGICR